MSGDPYLYPVQSTIHRVLYLRSHHAPEGTPLARVVGPAKVTAARITEILRITVKFLGISVGFLPDDVLARSLRAGGANTLILAKVDINIIRLIGRWQKNEMLKYLHVQAAPLMTDYAKRMISGGTFTLIPGQEVPLY